MNNTSTQWGWLAKSFHWVTALMIAVIVPVGYVMTSTYELQVTNQQMLAVNIALSKIHHTLGLLILIPVVLRLGWRLKQTTPDDPPGLVAYQRVLAKLNHVFLYVLLLLVPLSGWAALSVFGELPIYFFWMEGVPGILPKLPLGHTFGYSFFGRMHAYAIYVGGVVLALHIIAALWHHAVKKDSVLRRMWPLAQP
ncbi:cytochrome b [Povalibacter sp.]|uniref:cytochrome b n=1 Tax=Povalibacter sp. TaxID=1962978 RepID=UPI002F417E99